jgi:F0F1-type ATP synthase membrane subunit c/vacuolar-type H+-ATPase subunit K
MQYRYRYTNNAEEAAKEFVHEWRCAADKREDLVQLHMDFEGRLEELLEKMETHSSQHKTTQKNLCAVGLGVAIGVVASGGIAIGLAAPVVVSKWGSACRQRNRVQHQLKAAMEILDEDHKARNEFTEAAHRAGQAGDRLCEICPHLRGMRLSLLARSLIMYPGLLQNIAGEAVVLSLRYAVEEHPETALSVGLEVLNVAFDTIELIGVGTTLVLAEVFVEAVPIIGLGINLAKLRGANKALNEGSKDATRLRTVYDQSKVHYELLQEHMSLFNR